MLRFDHWDAGGGFVYLYTEEHSIAKELKREFGMCTVYFNGNTCFAWQFLVPSRILPLLKRKYDSPSSEPQFEVMNTEKISIEIQRLTGT